MQHVGLRTEVKLGILFLHINVNAMNAAPNALKGGGERSNGGE